MNKVLKLKTKVIILVIYIINTKINFDIIY